MSPDPSQNKGSKHGISVPRGEPDPMKIVNRHPHSGILEDVGHRRLAGA